MNILPLRQKAEKAASSLPALMVAAQRAVNSLSNGAHAQRKSGSGEKFWQFREYIPGDRPQDIDWRQSAKTQHVYIRQKERQTPQQMLLWCNRNASMDFSSDPKLPTKLETAQILTLALGLLASRSSEQVGFLGEGRTGYSEAALERLGQALCTKSTGLDSLPNPLQAKLPRHASLMQVGDFLDDTEAIEERFKAYQESSTSGFVIQILDPAEIDFKYTGRFVFKDPLTSSQEVINHTSSIQDEYKQKISDHIKTVENLTTSCGWHYILHRTDGDITQTLAQIWAIMDRSQNGKLN